jgi:hypothetical protein
MALRTQVHPRLSLGTVGCARVGPTWPPPWFCRPGGPVARTQNSGRRMTWARTLPPARPQLPCGAPLFPIDRRIAWSALSGGHRGLPPTMLRFDSYRERKSAEWFGVVLGVRLRPCWTAPGAPLTHFQLTLDTSTRPTSVVRRPRAAGQCPCPRPGSMTGTWPVSVRLLFDRGRPAVGPVAPTAGCPFDRIDER